MKITKTTLTDTWDLPWRSVGSIVGHVKLVQCQLIGHTRWSLIYEMVIEINGSYYTNTFQTGATELQEERPWEYNNEVDLIPVKPVEKTVTAYVML